MSGYTKIPNSILDSMSDLKPAAFKLAMALCRLTYGYHRSNVQASQRELQELTGLSRQGIINATDQIKHLFTSTTDDAVTTWVVNSVDKGDPGTGTQSVQDMYTECTTDGTQSVPPTSGSKEKKEKYKEKLPPTPQPADADVGGGDSDEYINKVWAYLRKRYDPKRSARLVRAQTEYADVSGLKQPYLNGDPADARKAHTDWWTPLDQMLSEVENDDVLFRRALEAVFERADKNELAISLPATAVKTFNGIVAGWRRGRGGSTAIKSVQNADGSYNL